MFDKILIANRGEVACRIMRTCKKMGIRTVAVFSEADKNSMHVQQADEAYSIGESSASDSYLMIEKLLVVAKINCVHAIHPGYGFLSENAEFASQCEKSGIVFIGPSADVIQKMGSKDQAKLIMENHEIPVVKGYLGALQKPDKLSNEAEKIGFPLLIKPVLGGGGKGIRLVRKKKEFLAALESAKREARNAFDDDRVILESFITRPRHIEFQIFGDHHGNLIHFFERDCSLQRRYQKIIEESPSPFLNEKLRTQMAEVAVKAAKALKYTGAGTVEFILGRNNKFYFMEMNTRLQVEHAVTEMVTGVDLVEWQIRIASGEKLPLTQEQVCKDGNAIEVRIFAENPEEGFLPSSGTLHRLVFPDFNSKKNAVISKISDDFKSTIRIDTGVKQGSEISIFYDPLIAKLIVHADSRKKAIAKMIIALSKSGIIGVDTNLSFLDSILRHPYFKSGEIDTFFIDSQLKFLIPKEIDAPDLFFWGAAISCFINDSDELEKKTQESIEANSPWKIFGNWRAGIKEPYSIFLANRGGKKKKVSIFREKNTFRILREKGDIFFKVFSNKNILNLTWRDKALNAYEENLMLVHHESEILAVSEKGRHFFTRQIPMVFENNLEVKNGEIISPMPGKIIGVMVKAGDKVVSGQPVLIIESMKMEHYINSPTQGTVKKVLFKKGEIVQNGEKLLEF